MNKYQAVQAIEILSRQMMSSKAAMRTSAQVCLEDAVSTYDRGMYTETVSRAMKGLSFLGINAAMRDEVRAYIESEESFLDQFSNDYVADICRDVAEDFFGDWPDDQGIGSSDINAAVRRAMRDLGVKPDFADIAEPALSSWLRQEIRFALSKALA